MSRTFAKWGLWPATNTSGVSPVQAAARYLPPWAAWVAGRLLSSVAGLVVISLLVFITTQALPSDPARVILGPEAPEDAVATLRVQLGLDQPIGRQYLQWVGQLLTGDLGISIDSHLPIAQLLAPRIANSAVLLGLVLVTLVPLALILGIYLALHRDSRLDRTIIPTLVVLKAIPSFAIAFGLVLVFSTNIVHWLPAVSLFDASRPLWSQWSYFVLPGLTLVLTTLPYLTRLVRSSMIEILESEFITHARLRGLPEFQVIWRYALPNGLIPLIQAIALIAGVLLGGALVVEVVFAYPGIGTALNAAVDVRDVPVIQAIVLVLTSAIMLLNLTADIASAFLTPKLRTRLARSPS